MPRPIRWMLSIVVIAMVAALLAAGALAADETWGTGRGGRALAIVLGVSLLMQLMRLGYDYDDGIDVKQLLLPAPFDWGVKVERMVHFWTSPRMWFRSIYLGSIVALVIVGMRFAARN